MNPFIALVQKLVSLYSSIVIIAVFVSIMKNLGMLDSRNHIVMRISHFLDAMTEPFLSRIRKVIKPISGIDLSPLVLLVGIQFLCELLVWLL